MSKKNKFTILFVSFLLLLVGGGYYAYYRWSKAASFNRAGDKNARIYVYPEMTWNEVVDQIIEVTDTHHAGDLRFLLNNVAKTKPIVGSYLIEKNDKTRSLYNRLVYGYQSPINLIIQSKRLPGGIYKSLSRQLMMDSLQVAKAMNDRELLQKYGVQDSTLVYKILPNSYEVYWTITPEQLVERMVKENNAFWTTTRLEKAEALGLTPNEVIILASIVQEESNKVDEYPNIAGLYLNRLRMGMRLQSDPTIKFALQDFTLKRILHKHLRVSSPYNTYQNVGLPPSPIRIPDISAIDGVLNAKDHKYVYMCAKSDFSGYHVFAETYSEHIKNARLYTAELNKRGIK